jgi:hypothetical protein
MISPFNPGRSPEIGPKPRRGCSERQNLSLCFLYSQVPLFQSYSNVNRTILRLKRRWIWLISSTAALGWHSSP